MIAKNTVKSAITNYRMANIPNQFDNIRVINGSDEKIFDDIFVTALLQNNRIVKFKKSSLEFLA